MSFAVVYPRTIRNGASFEEVADGDFLLSERQVQNFASSARDVGVNNHSIRDGSNGFRRRHGFRWTIKIGNQFSEVFTRSGVIGGLAPDAWFKGDEEVTITDGFVSGWGDLGGHSRNTVQATENQRPTTAELNGIQVVNTDTSTQGRMVFESQLATAKSAIFVVDNYQQSDDGDFASAVFGELDLTPTQADYVLLLIDNGAYTISVDGNMGRAGRASIDNGTLTAGTNIDLGVDLVSGDGPNVFYVDWNNTAVRVNFLGGFQTSDSDVFGALSIAEIIFFSNDLTEQQRTDVYEKYLKPLWGL